MLNIAELQLLRGLLYSHILECKSGKEGKIADEFMIFMEKTLQHLNDMEERMGQYN